MSISLSSTELFTVSKLPSAVTRCLPLPLPLADAGALAFSLAALFDFDFACASGVRATFGGRGDRVCSTGFSGAETGGSSGL